MNPDLSNKKVIIVADGAFPTHPEPLSLLREAGFVVCCDGAAASLINYGIEPEVIIGDLDSLSPELAERFSDRLLPDPDQETNDLTKAVNWSVGHKATDLTILGATGKREDHTLGNISLLADYGKIKASSASPANTHSKPVTNEQNAPATPANTYSKPVTNEQNAPATPADNHIRPETTHYNSTAASAPNSTTTPAESSITVKMVTDTGILFPVYGTCTIETFPGQPVSIFSLDSTTEVTSTGLKYPLNKVILNSWWIATLNIATGTSFTLTLAAAPLIIYLGHPQP